MTGRGLALVEYSAGSKTMHCVLSYKSQACNPRGSASLDSKEACDRIYVGRNNSLA